MKTEVTTTRSEVSGRLELYSHLGHFSVDMSQVITFPLGLPGFEQCRRFVMLDAEDCGPLQYLHGVEEPVAFLVLDPRLLMPGYRCVLSQTDLVRLGATENDVLLWLSIVSVDESGEAFANLRAPLVVNPGRMLGFQVMPHNSLYPLRHPLASE